MLILNINRKPYMEGDQREMVNGTTIFYLVWPRKLKVEVAEILKPRIVRRSRVPSYIIYILNIIRKSEFEVSWRAGFSAAPAFLLWVRFHESQGMSFDNIFPN